MQTQRLNPQWLAAALTLAGCLAAPEVAAQRQRLTVPGDTVVRLELDSRVSSRTARVGDRVVAKVDEEDRSGFPRDTRFEGVVTEVRRATDKRPAVLDMEFRRAVLPNGSSERIRADLASLSEDDVRRGEDGRLVSRRSGGGFDLKWVGYGAAGGAVLGEILGDDFLKGGLLGGLGGAIYGYLNRDDDREYREVELDRGTEFGIRLDQAVAFDSRPDFRFADRTQVAGARDEYRLDDAAMWIDDRRVRFGDDRPLRVNGTVYVPLRAVADAAGWTLRREPLADEFSLITPRERIRGQIGSHTVTRGSRTHTLDAAPMTIGGELYVPLEAVSRVGDTRVRWERGNRRSGRLGSERPRAGELVRGLEAFPFSDLRTSVVRWQRVNVEDALPSGERQLLGSLLSGNSLARRNQNLLTNLLRDAELISRRQTVVGVSMEDQTLYVD